MIIQGSRCPKCQGLIEYDGNYWCTDQETCGWILPDWGRMSRNDKQAFLVAYVLYMQQTGREPCREVLEEYM